jgi:hypothetical protein
MGHRLHLDVQAMLGVFQLFVDLPLARWQRAHRHAERAAPEVRGSIKIGGLAIDDESS